MLPSVQWPRAVGEPRRRAGTPPVQVPAKARPVSFLINFCGTLRRAVQTRIARDLLGRCVTKKLASSDHCFQHWKGRLVYGR